MNEQAKVMLLVDADNVSVGVVEQAVERLLGEHGALHVRRAYCTAESARKNQAVFKRLGMRPMVNLAAGKNSTDIALAVDAIDLVIAERPAVVVIASSDSDFAPLVSRLREKGCRVCGIGQEGKTGAETVAVYDEFVELPAKAARRTVASKRATTAGRRAAATPPENAVPASPGLEAGSDDGAADAAPAPVPAAKRKPAPRKVAAKAPRKNDAKSKAEPAPVAPAASGTPVRRSRPAARLPSGRASAPRDEAKSSDAAVPLTQPAEVQQLLQALPALARGERLELQRAAELLRRAGRLSRRSTAQKLFARYPQWFDLQPAGEPRHVALRPASVA